MLVTSSLHVRVTVINGRMDKSEQLEKVPCDPSELLLVIAISVAETSTTIDGLVVVFDSGLIGESRFEPTSNGESTASSQSNPGTAKQRCTDRALRSSRAFRLSGSVADGRAAS